MACYALGGSKNSVHSEDIMNKAFLWNKERFGWKKKTYSNYPDTVPLSQGLFDARKYGFLKGKYDRNYLSKDGWTLTDKGLEKAESLSSLVDVKTSKITLSQFQRKTLANFKKHDHFNLKTMINYYEELNTELCQAIILLTTIDNHAYQTTLL